MCMCVCGWVGAGHDRRGGGGSPRKVSGGVLVGSLTPYPFF